MTNKTKPPKPKFLCPICNKLWKSGQNSIQCSNCEKWIHAPPNKLNCSLLSMHAFMTYSQSSITWFCTKCDGLNMPFNILNDIQLYLEINNNSSEPSDELQLFPDHAFREFSQECHQFLINYTEDDTDLTDNFNQVNSKYYDINEINLIKTDKSSSIGFLHTNLASLYKHHSDLTLVLSLLKIKFHIIAITEHKIKDDHPIQNIEIPNYHDFVYDPATTSHGGTGFFILKSLVYVKRDDLKLKAPNTGDFESTFIEIILPNKKNLILGCIYRHPSSNINISQFNDRYIEPLLQKITMENKICVLMGDFNINLLKIDSQNDIK